jgi:virulence-associated protein VapD
MYAIAFDLDTAQLQELYSNGSWQNAYNDIKKELKEFGFDRQQGSVYFGNTTNQNINAVTCVLAAQSLSKKYEWFKPSVRDIRLLKIEDFNDLTPAL